MPESSSDGFSLFERPGEMIEMPGGNRLSLYCVGEGRPTIVMETGFGGGAFYTWHEIQPRLAQLTRTCSYDRAGNGFSELGFQFPRDLEHFVQDLHDLLARSEESSPYVLVAHSNGGRIIGTFADRYPDEVRGLVFLDAAVRLPDDKGEGDNLVGPSEVEEIPQSLREHLERIRSCLDHAISSDPPAVLVRDSGCLDENFLSQLPDEMSRVMTEWASKPDYWRSYLSEAECNYGTVECTPSPPLADEWLQGIPVRVITASVAALENAEFAPLFGLAPDDTDAIAEARQGRVMGEDRQARICEFASDCRVSRLPTADHYVQNAYPDEVVEIIAELL